jgi:hypothetical protein
MRTRRCFTGILLGGALLIAVFISQRTLKGADDQAPARTSDDRKDHWAFRPVSRPQIPIPGTPDWARNPIDCFISSRLALEKLQPCAEADRRTLIRRLKFDLLGLPPTPEEVDAFVKDEGPEAYDRLVERYLASPHFGERWARHWLDVVRFAETTGFETNALRPSAWPYRDYVIRAFNQNKPYDRFIQDQLAGDAGDEPEATGYLVAGAFDQVKGDPLLNAQQRADELHDMVSTTGSAFCGLTVGCARCHNHKFDPVSQLDYYGMKAIFEGVRHGTREVVLGDPRQFEREAGGIARELASIEARLAKLEPRIEPPSQKKGSGKPLRPSVSHQRNCERFAPVEARFLRMTILATADNAEPCVDELEVLTAEENPRNIALAAHGTRATASGTLSGYAIHKLEFVNDGRYGNSRSWISNERGKGWLQLEFPETARIETIIWSRNRDGAGYSDRVPIRYRFEVAIAPGEWQTVASSEDRLPPGPPGQAQPEPPGLSADDLQLYRKYLEQERALIARRGIQSGPMQVYAGQFANPEPTYLLDRGEITRKGQRVAPAAPAQFGAQPKMPMDAPEHERRAVFAQWIADPKNPFTSRVMVNRLWQHHFGTGIVATPSDFGINGARPIHPELLDWLADEFVSGGWDIKRIHRLIVLSSTYRQDSRANPAGTTADAGTRLLWRFPARRMEAEPLRDAILFVSGKLDLHMGGPGFELFEPNRSTVQGVRVYVSKKEFGPPEWRRMIYQSKPRMRLDDTFGAFDCPDAGQTAPQRTVSTTALQVFNLLNSPFMLQQAGFFAERLQAEAGEDTAAQVRLGFRLAYQRAPADDELAEGTRLAREHGTRAFCLALFNASEFMYVP